MPNRLARVPEQDGPKLVCQFAEGPSGLTQGIPSLIVRPKLTEPQRSCCDRLPRHPFPAIDCWVHSNQHRNSMTVAGEQVLVLARQLFRSVKRETSSNSTVYTGRRHRTTEVVQVGHFRISIGVHRRERRLTLRD